MPLVNLQMGNIEAQFKQIAHRKIVERANALCEIFNNEFNMLGQEVAYFDKNLFYDPDTATQTESHLLHHLGEAFYCTVEETDDPMNVRVKVNTPDMTISDKVLAAIEMAKSNATRLFNARSVT